MISTLLLLLAITLIVLSAWRYAALIIACVVASAALMEIEFFLREGMNGPRLLGELLLVGILFYVVMIQKTLKRTISSIVTREEYKSYLIESNSFRGFQKFVYYLPLLLLATMFTYVVYWYAAN
jgi:hypothetical protein